MARPPAPRRSPPRTAASAGRSAGCCAYRKFFARLDPVIASANNPACAGLDLTPAQVGGHDWPVTRIDSATELTLRYGYTA
ncbi:hypothetical protein [Kitasatospora sp. NBC_00315]|uniref:hypothetical protein n=1 Tax=Kitasatospora sp. NBC_00315 TaxID=2975963 RepID=UPI00324CB72B